MEHLTFEQATGKKITIEPRRPKFSEIVLILLLIIVILLKAC